MAILNDELTRVQLLIDNRITELTIPLSELNANGLSDNFTLCDKYKDTLYSIGLPLRIKTINSHAFSNCSSLSNVYISNNTTEIGKIGRAHV